MPAIQALPDHLRKELKRVKRSFKDPHMRVFAGLSPNAGLKVKETVEEVEPPELPASPSLPVEDYKKGTQAIFIPLSMVTISAKTRKNFYSLRPGAVIFTTSMTKAGNYQTNFLLDDLSSASEITCRAPHTCFLVPPVALTAEMLAGVTKIIEREELKLQNQLQSIFGDRAYSSMPSGATVCFYPQQIQEISKVRGICMLGRVYQATYEGTSDSGGVRLSMVVNSEKFEFTAKRGSFCCKVSPESFLQAQELITASETALMSILKTYLEGSEVATAHLNHLHQLSLEVPDEVLVEEPVWDAAPSEYPYPSEEEIYRAIEEDAAARFRVDLDNAPEESSDEVDLDLEEPTQRLQELIAVAASETPSLMESLLTDLKDSHTRELQRVEENTSLKVENAILATKLAMMERINKALLEAINS